MFTQVRAKCLECGLHFTVHTWYPEKHAGTTLHCPECGQHEQRFATWVVEVEGEIFEYVPGDAELDSIGGHPVSERIDHGQMKIVWGEESFNKEDEFLTEKEEEN